MRSLSVNQRVYWVFFLSATSLVFSVFPSNCSGQEPDFFREWISKDGVKMEASLQSFDMEVKEPTVVLKKRNAKIVEAKLSAFSDADQNFVKLRQALSEDLLQFEQVVDNLDALRTTPNSVIESFLTFSRQYKTSPYANVYACVSLAAGQNNTEKAIKVGLEAIERIKAQRALDSSRHSRTLAAAHNNLAICFVKQKRAKTAAEHFVQALKYVERIPPVLAHNINSLVDASKMEFGLKLEPKERQALLDAKKDLKNLEPKRKMQAGWYYSLDLDTPNSLQNELSVAGALPPDYTLELIASGTGVVCAPGYVLTVKTTVVHPHRSASLATIAVPESLKQVTNNREDNQITRWKLLPARQVIMTQQERIDISGSTTIADSVSDSSIELNSNSTTKESFSGSALTISDQSNNQGRSQSESLRERNRTTDSKGKIQSKTRAVSNTTNYVLTQLQPGVEQELAVLQVDQLNINAIVFSSEIPKANQGFSLFSFQRGPDMLQKDRSRSEGKFMAGTNESTTFLSSLKFSGGNRGAACFDEDFRVRGLAWSTQKTGNAYTGVGFTADAIREWFAINVKAADLRFEDPDDLKKSEESILKATVPILVWGRRSENELSNPIFNEFYNDDNLVELYMLRDEFCMGCKGTGSRNCGTCVGQGEVQRGLKIIQTGVNPVNGQPLTAQVPNLVSCPSCSGARKILCTYCNQGKVAGGPKP